MYTNSSYFKIDAKEKIYQKLECEFLHHFENTIQRCEKMCTKQYNQERNFSISYHPEIENKKEKIKRASETIHAELTRIQNYSEPEKKIKELVSYGNGLSELDFDNLFMTIFSGKLKKHWIKLAVVCLKVTTSQPQETLSLRNSDGYNEASY